MSEMQKLYKDSDLFSGPIMNAIVNAPPSDDAYMAVFSKKGVIASMNKLKAKGAIREKAYKEWNSKAEKLARSLEDDFKRTADTLPGRADDILTPRGKFVADYGEVLKSIEKNADFSPVSMDTVKTRLATLTQGLTVGHGGWTLEMRRKLMIAALVGSYLAMRTDATLEKYGTCGGGKMCLHFPAVYGDDNNEPYQQDEHLTQNYEGLVMGALPALGKDEVDRFHIMSPCKTDLVVAAYEQSDWRCKCEEFYKHDRTEIVYKMQKMKCEADERLKRPVPINADGSCPKKYNFAGTEYDVKVVAGELKKTHDGGETFSCDFSGVPYDDINEALDECIYKFMHKDGCEDDPGTDYDDCLIDMYRDCYAKGYSDNTKYCTDDGGVCDHDGHCWGFTNDEYFPVPLSKHKDTFAIPVNAKENVNTGVLEPITVCTNSWLSSFTGGQLQDYKPCIVVRYEVDSMRAYSKAGFGANYCAENKAQLADVLEGTCFWGGMAGAVAVSALSGGVTGTVIIPVAIGSASIGCEKIADMQTKWPQSQY